MDSSTVIQFVNAQLQWAVARVPSGRYVGECAAMGIAMEGDTMDELVAAINESVQLVMNRLLRSGDLQSFLTERGWRTISGVPALRELRGPVEFDVPIQLLMQAQRDSARAIRQ